jgi:hypothetical protein
MTDARNLPDFEIIGLHASANHRSCKRHQVCGQHVFRNDTLRLLPCLLEKTGHEPEAAIKLVKIEDGHETCTVAFMSKSYAMMPKIYNNINQFATVLELYSDSPSPFKQHMSEKQFGMASCRFLAAIQTGMD